MTSKSFHSTFYKNMQILSQFYPFDEDLSQTFVKGMFKKGNWKGFLNVIHYLLTIIEPSKVQFSTVLLDPKAKLNFRSTISKTIKDLRMKHPDLNLKKFEPSAFVNPGGKDIEELVLKLSYLALYVHLKKDNTKNESPESSIKQSDKIVSKISSNFIFKLQQDFIQKHSLENININKIRLILEKYNETGNEKEIEMKLLKTSKERNTNEETIIDSRILCSQLIDLLKKDQDLFPFYEKTNYLFKILENIKDKFPVYFLIYITQYIMLLLENVFNSHFNLNQETEKDCIEEYVDNYFKIEKDKEFLNNITKETLASSASLFAKSCDEIIKDSGTEEDADVYLRIYQDNISPLRFNGIQIDNKNTISDPSWSDIWKQFDNNILNTTQDLKQNLTQEKTNFINISNISALTCTSFMKSSSEEDSSRTTTTATTTTTSNSKSEESDINESIQSNVSQSSGRRQSVQDIIDRYNRFKAKQQILS